MSTTKTFTEARAALAQGATVTAATEAALATARQHADLNAFLELFDESALQQASAVDAREKAGNAGALAGLVLNRVQHLDDPELTSEQAAAGAQPMLSSSAAPTATSSPWAAATRTAPLAR